MNFIEEKEQEYKDNIERIEDDLRDILKSLKNSRPFGDFYEDAVDSDLNNEDIIGMYMHNFQTYLDRKEMLEEYRSDYTEFRELKDDPTFQKEYKQLVKARRKLADKIDEIFIDTRRANFVIVLPRNHEDWFTLDYTKERWADIFQTRQTVVSTDRLFPVIEIISLGGSLEFREEDTDEDIPTINVDVTNEYQQSVVHKVDLADIIKKED